MLIATNAIVLKRIPYGDTGIIFRVFTEELGKVSVLAKGAWKPKNAAGPLLEPINHLHIQFYNKNTRNIQILKDADLYNELFFYCYVFGFVTPLTKEYYLMSHT